MRKCFGFTVRLGRLACCAYIGWYFAINLDTTFNGSITASVWAAEIALAAIAAWGFDRLAHWCDTKPPESLSQPIAAFISDCKLIWAQRPWK